MAHLRENRVSLLLSSCTIIANRGEQQLRAITSELRLQLRPVGKWSAENMGPPLEKVPDRITNSKNVCLIELNLEQNHIAISLILGGNAGNYLVYIFKCFDN